MGVLAYMFVALLSFGLSVCISFVLHYWLWPTATKGAASRKQTSKEGKVSNAGAAESPKNERKVRRRKELMNQCKTEIFSVEDKDEPYGEEKPESENDREETHCGAQPPADNQPNEDANLQIDSIVQQLATAFPNATFAGNDSAFMYMSAFETIDRPTDPQTDEARPTDNIAQVQECITTTTAETTTTSLDSDHRHTDVEEEFWAKCNNTDFCQICSTTFTFFLRRVPYTSSAPPCLQMSVALTHNRSIFTTQHHCRMCYSSICAR